MKYVIVDSYEYKLIVEYLKLMLSIIQENEYHIDDWQLDEIEKLISKLEVC